MARIGYARVSSIDQDLKIQLAKLKDEGCDLVRSEKASAGSRDGRTELDTRKNPGLLSVFMIHFGEPWGVPIWIRSRCSA